MKDGLNHLVFLATAALVAVTFLAPQAAPSRPGPVADALSPASRSDRSAVSGFYKSLADITRRDAGSQIKTTAEWRQVHSSALKLWLAGTGKVGKFPGLDTSVDAILLKALGDKVANMADQVDGKKRYESVADACLEVSEQAR